MNPQVRVICIPCGELSRVPLGPGEHNVPRCPNCGGLRVVEMEFVEEEEPK